eukprot:Nitzschia sp. Nitz4//scaffold137_size62074//13117//14328//NITZ4_006408-RA/size62074-exonerate_est2genome-gene-0.53-mRNA-1//1//CDS//3329535679//7519//frame0
MNDQPNGSFSAGQRVNPMVPDSVGALLAEEWTINPQSTLPSFLEMTMMSEARRSLWRVIGVVIAKIQSQLDLLGQADEGQSRRSLIVRLASGMKLPVAARALEKVLARYAIEVQFLVMYWIERTALLSSSAASLSEIVYHGKRVKLGETVGSSHRKLGPMAVRDGVRLALLIAFGHYMEEKGQKIYDNISKLNSEGLTRLQRGLLLLYPSLYTVLKSANLAQRWRFLVGQTVYYDMHSEILRLVVRRVTASDAAQTDEQSSDTGSQIAGMTSSILPSVVDVVGSESSKMAAFILLTSAVGVTWLARLQSLRRKLRSKTKVEDPDYAPPTSKPLPDKVGVLRNCPTTHCPLCRQPRVNPTASTGGYVFCLVCLTSFVRENAVCPITGKDCPETSLVRLFEPQTV